MMSSVRSFAVPGTLVALLAAVPATPPATTPAPPVAAAPAPAATTPAPAAPAPAAPPSPVSGIRNKVSAADLLSAESILEVHRETHGENAQWLAGLGWLARGALLLGDTAKASRYAAQLRRECATRLQQGPPLEKNRDVEGPLGAAIEVQAQLVEQRRGRAAAAEFVRGELAANRGPAAFRSRLQKRINLLTLVGRTAPELQRDGPTGAPVPSLASLRGHPVLLFVWAEWCADCKAQAASLAKVLERHRADGLACVTLTRRYEESDSALVVETARADSVWRAVYSGLGDVRHAVSTASMVEYGGSSTPTFAFIDRGGIVRGYTPTRLTEEELERALQPILR